MYVYVGLMYVYVVLIIVYVVAGYVPGMEPREVVRKGTIAIEQFIDNAVENLPDISERPEIALKATRFWMMDDKGDINPKKRFPKPHSRLPGLRGQHVNASIDFAIALNKWPVAFKDDDDTTINLVSECICAVWLDYIAKLKGHPLPESNSCQLVLKYMLLNQEQFVKAYHDRMYFFSSGTKFAAVSGPINAWMKLQDRQRAAYAEDNVRRVFSCDVYVRCL
jgi:hypothetical protein